MLFFVTETTDIFLIHFAGKDDKLISFPAQPGEQLLLFTDFGKNRHVGIQAGEDRENVPQGSGGAGPHPDGAAAKIKGTDMINHILRLPEDFLSVFHCHPGIFIELDFIFPAGKKRNLQLRLQFLHGTAQGRLRQMQLFGRGGKSSALGYGDQLFQVPDAAQCEQAVLDAIASGYRLIDTAAAYMNEAAVGAAIKKCGVPREELFITTKLWVQDADYESAKKAIQTSLDKLGLDYLDLYLIHQPMGDYIGAYRAMAEAYKEGKLRAIGVCNFYPARLADFCETVEVTPAVDQVELHPFFAQENALALMKEYGVVPEAWEPFAEGNHGIFTHPVLTKIGEKYGKSAAQVALRWNVQRGVVVIPKSVHKNRMEQNMDIWDFELGQEDMAEIAKLDLGHSEIVNHDDPGFVKMLHSMKIHQ